MRRQPGHREEVLGSNLCAAGCREPAGAASVDRRTTGTRGWSTAPREDEWLRTMSLGDVIRLRQMTYKEQDVKKSPNVSTLSVTSHNVRYGGLELKHRCR